MDGLVNRFDHFKSLHSINSEMQQDSNDGYQYYSAPRSQIHQQGQPNAAFGYEEDIMMTDMTVNRPSSNGDNESVASTDSSTESISKSLPSHLIKELRHMPSAKGARRTIKRPGSTRNRRPGSQRSERDEMDFKNMEVEETENPTLPGDVIRHMATSMGRKKGVLNQLQESQKQQEKNISTYRYFKLRLATHWQHFKKKMVGVFRENMLWDGPLKEIQGKFGTGVLSYFVFLRWLLLLNVLIFFLVLVFIVIPQIIYRPSLKYANLTNFHGADIVDGTGWFNGTELYYGHYTSDTIPISDDSSYEMPLAYLFTCSCYLMLCLIILVKSMASLYNQNYLEGGVGRNVFTVKVFTSWDYSVTDRDAGAIKQQSIAIDIQECLAETKDKRVLSHMEKFKIFLLRLLTHFLCIALIACATYLIVEVVAGYSVEDDTTVFKELLLPLLVSALNLILPGLFRIIASFEKYEHGATVVQISLARTVILKLCTLAGIFVALYTDINCTSSEGIKPAENRTRTEPEYNEGKDFVSNSNSNKCRIYGCWENYVGQTFYRLVWVDFAFILLATFFGEFVRRLLSSNIEWWKDNIGHPGFDISRNVLDLIYAQCLCWFGTFFSPLLSFICLFKLWVIFYVKKISVLNNCRPSVRPFLASKMNLVFLVLLGISYALILIVFGYTITSGSRLRPSDCGPFKGKESIYHVVLETVERFPSVLKEIIQYTASPSIVAILFLVLGVVIYYYKLLKTSNEEKMKLLREQIILTGKDKLYLMKLINERKK